jgi:hypothetical protein
MARAQKEYRPMADDIARNYADQIAEMRQQRHTAEQREQLRVIEDNYKTACEWRDEAAEKGDTEEWHNSDKWAEELEQEYAKIAPQGPQYPAYVTPENVAYVQRCGDLNNPVNDAKFRQCMATAEKAGINLSDPAQFREALEKFYSPGVFQNGQLVPGTEGPIVPPDYQPMPDRNEAYRIATANSKYGKDLKADEWVRGEAEVKRRKNLGYYPDRGRP